MKMTSGRMLARNTVWNLLGNAAPLLVAIGTIPICIRWMGADRFGVLNLAWAVIGYFSLFDLGLGRALTQILAQKLAAKNYSAIPGLVWTSLLLLLAFGIAGGVVLGLLASRLVFAWLRIPPDLQHEALRSFYWLALAIPMVVMSAGLRGILEAKQAFGLITAVRIPLGAFTFAAPVLVLLVSQDLSSVVAVLVLGRAVAVLVQLGLCLRVLPVLRENFQVRWDLQKPLLRFGGWLTVSNVVGPVMLYLDRFLIGALVSAAALAYYATPYELITKMWILSSALGGVLFPAFAATFAEIPQQAALLYHRAVKFLFLALFPVALAAISLAEPGLRLWLGSSFAANSYRVLQWLAIGVFVNCLGSVPFTFLQGSGRADMVAKVHILELPLYVVTVWWMVGTYGIVGAAIAWTLRMCVETLLFFFLARSTLALKTTLDARTLGVVLGGGCAFAVAMLPTRSVVAWTYLIFVLVFFGCLSWFHFLSMSERQMLARFALRKS